MLFSFNDPLSIYIITINESLAQFRVAQPVVRRACLTVRMSSFRKRYAPAGAPCKRRSRAARPLKRQLAVGKFPQPLTVFLVVEFAHLPKLIELVIAPLRGANRASKLGVSHPARKLQGGTPFAKLHHAHELLQIVRINEDSFSHAEPSLCICAG